MTNKTGPIHILLVEDNPGDVRLTQEALHELRVAIRLHDVPDGHAALDFMLKTPPDLILLDLNLPRMGGLELLQHIKQQHDLRHIPVIILTTSESQQDIRDSYRLGANAYISKPVDLDHFIRLMQAFEDFWFFTAKLP